MSQTPDHRTPDSPAAGEPAGFGANEWLVDEMYERFQADPSSVPGEWAAWFRGGGANGSAGSNGSATTSEAATPVPAPAGATAPAPAPATSPAPVAGAPAAPARPAPVARPRPQSAAAEPARGTTAPMAKEAPPTAAAQATDEPSYTVLRGAPARTVTNMDASLTVPTATSVRSVPVKLLWDNRIVINNHLARARGGKVSFTHIIGFAMVKALRAMPEMNVGFDVVDGKPTLIQPAHVNLGLAIDMAKPDGTRQLLVPSIKAAEAMDFAAFWTAYEQLVTRARDGKLTVEDFQGTTISLTNPGTIGTQHSVPRLMKGQGAIIGVGSMEYPPEFQGASEDTLTRHAVSKVMTLTSTYDHRVIQGAQSGEYLRRLHRLLLGEDGFFDEIFRSLRIPYQPIRWAQDISTSHDDEISKQARIQELIHAYRVRGHMMADTDPLEYKQKIPPRPRGGVARPDPVGPRPRVRHGLLRRRAPLHEDAQHPRDPA